VAQLLVRKIEASLVEKLRRRAAAEGISMEEEHRRILRQALISESPKKKGFKEHLLALSGALDEADLMPRSKDMPREIDL
jgi:plasmid stability protein